MQESSEAGRGRIWVVLGVLVCLVGVGAWIAHGRQSKAQVAKGPGSGAPGAAGQAARPPVPVVVAAVRTGDLSVYLTALGSVTPLSTVTVKSRIDGQLMRTHFMEGQLVHAGDLLA